MNDPLFGNKIAGAILAAALIFFGLPQIASAVLGGGAHHGKHHELKLAYPIEFKTEGAEGDGPAAVMDLGTLLATASPDAGKRRVALCASCHTFEKGGNNLQGPNLWGIVGRPVATHEGFAYSAPMKSFGGEWSYERLFDYIHAPQKVVPGTAMSFAGIAKPEQRAELLVYLRTLSDSPLPLPSPAAAPPAEAAEAPEGATPEAPATDKAPG